MKKANSATYQKWLFFAVGGLLLIVFGVSLTGEAIILKAQNNNFWTWGSCPPWL